MESIKSLSDVPTLPVLYLAKRLSSPNLAYHGHNPSYNEKIALVRCDITTLKVDSIVNAANESLLGGGGVDGAIHRAAGPRLFRECEALNGCDTGSAKMTEGYRLPAKKVIHAVGPIYWKEKPTGRHEPLLRGCYRTSLQLAERAGLKSIAFSALSTGVYGYPSDLAAAHAISEVRNFFDEGHGQGIERVVFCNFMEKDERAYLDTLPLYFPPEGTKIKEAPAKSLPSTNTSSATPKPVITLDSDDETVIERSKIDSNPTKVASDLPDPPTEEPTPKKAKTFDDTAVDDDDWVEIDKESIPKKVTVEDAEDEEDKHKV